MSPSCFIPCSTLSSATSALSLHDALPISSPDQSPARARDQLATLVREVGLEDDEEEVAGRSCLVEDVRDVTAGGDLVADHHRDRKSTRLNSSHMSISYAVFCLKQNKFAEI